MRRILSHLGNPIYTAISHTRWVLAAPLGLSVEALAAAPPSLHADVTAARAAGRAAREELARIAAGDAGWMLARGGLAAALLDLARSAGAEASARINGDIADVAWFAASGALTNALKHAGPARIWLSAATEAACLRVHVADDGVVGADPDGRGLRGLAERLAEHSCRLHVLGEERGGTTVVAEIPVNDSQQATVAPRQVRQPAELPADSASAASGRSAAAALARAQLVSREAASWAPRRHWVASAA
jgi:signal transduction histidine kinase